MRELELDDDKTFELDDECMNADTKIEDREDNNFVAVHTTP